MFHDVAYWGGAIALGVFAVISALHALLNKRDPRSQLGWLVLCAMIPFFGAALYWVLGVNRIRTRARKWQKEGLFELESEADFHESAADKLASEHPSQAENLLALLQISRRVTGKPLMRGNRVVPLFNGEQAYPEMIAAIAEAKNYIFLCSYLFDTDPVGRQFIDAIAAAGARGVDVRVLVDAIGERYSRPRASKLLAGLQGVRVARFLPIAISLRGLRLNLRNHRKILAVDGRIGFTGGMNLGERHMVAAEGNPDATADVHFAVSGPAVYALEEAFFEDWFFTTGDRDWNSAASPEPVGGAMCRGVKDGPNEDFEKLQWILVGALTCARKCVKIVTPYFIPSRELVAALTSAALRGVQVQLILPAKSNLRFVDWASRSMLSDVLVHGIEVYLQPAPFNHSKLFIVDDFYVNLGSANLDPRSLQLNFEFNLEVYDPALGGPLAAHFMEIRARSERLTLEAIESASLAVRLRNATAKLFAPYL